jgi:hypothetical protein
MKHDPVIETNNTTLSVIWKLSFKFHPQLKKKKKHLDRRWEQTEHYMLIF